MVEGGGMMGWEVGAFESEFAGGVGADGGIAPPGGLRTHEDEYAALLGAEVGEDGARDGDGAVEVGAELAV